MNKRLLAVLLSASMVLTYGQMAIAAENSMDIALVEEVSETVQFKYSADPAADDGETALDEEQAEKLTAFINEARGKVLSQEFIYKTFADCFADTVAQKMLNLM